MKFYSYILVMKKETFFIFAVMIGWIWMVLWTFFWWTGEKPEIKEEPTGFIEQIVETWVTEWIPEQSKTEEQTWSKKENEYYNGTIECTKTSRIENKELVLNTIIYLLKGILESRG